MSAIHSLRSQFDELEVATVSDSFGGPSVGGRAPDFNFSPILSEITSNPDAFGATIGTALQKISDQGFAASIDYIVKSAGRFAFCIELTNLKITSTKNKTRWLDAKIVKTKPGTFQNYEGFFRPFEDQRSSTFDECFALFETALKETSNSVSHLKIFESLSSGKNRGIPYESLYTYKDTRIERIHLVNNFKLSNLSDICWLIQARPIMYSALRTDTNGQPTKVVDKIKTKAYKTDRSQTGEVQTNRAKRWECLNIDFQHASIEECWSVERKLLEDICNFSGFPASIKNTMIELDLLTNTSTTRCPITLKELNFNELLEGGEHGESKFQVGHLDPLKSGGRHCGTNIAWISDDGNRIQGSLSISETTKMLLDIFNRMGVNNID